MSYCFGVRWACIFILALAGVAAAQPVSFQLQGQVPVGQKPKLVVKATQAVSDIRVELERDDGKKFTMK